MRGWPEYGVPGRRAEGAEGKPGGVGGSRWGPKERRWDARGRGSGRGGARRGAELRGGGTGEGRGRGQSAAVTALPLQSWTRSGARRPWRPRGPRSCRRSARRVNAVGSRLGSGRGGGGEAASPSSPGAALPSGRNLFSRAACLSAPPPRKVSLTWEEYGSLIESVTLWVERGWGVK